MHWLKIRTRMRRQPAKKLPQRLLCQPLKIATNWPPATEDAMTAAPLRTAGPISVDQAHVGVAPTPAVAGTGRTGTVAAANGHTGADRRDLRRAVRNDSADGNSIVAVRPSIMLAALDLRRGRRCIVEAIVAIPMIFSAG